MDHQEEKPYGYVWVVLFLHWLGCHGCCCSCGVIFSCDVLVIGAVTSILVLSFMRHAPKVGCCFNFSLGVFFHSNGHVSPRLSMLVFLAIFCAMLFRLCSFFHFWCCLAPQCSCFQLCSFSCFLVEFSCCFSTTFLFPPNFSMLLLYMEQFMCFAASFNVRVVLHAKLFQLCSFFQFWFCSVGDAVASFLDFSVV